MLFLKCVSISMLIFTFQHNVNTNGELFSRKKYKGYWDNSKKNGYNTIQKYHSFSVNKRPKNGKIESSNSVQYRANDINSFKNVNIERAEYDGGHKVQTNTSGDRKKNLAKRRQKQKVRVRALKREKTRWKKRTKNLKRKNKKQENRKARSNFASNRKMNYYTNRPPSTIKSPAIRLHKINQNNRKDNYKKKRKILSRTLPLSRVANVAITATPAMTNTEVRPTMEENQQDTSPSDSVTTEVPYIGHDYCYDNDNNPPLEEPTTTVTNSLTYYNVDAEATDPIQVTERFANDEYDPYGFNQEMDMSATSDEPTTVTATTSSFKAGPILKFLSDPNMRPFMRAPIHLISLIGRFRRNQKSIKKDDNPEAITEKPYRSNEERNNNDEEYFYDRATENNENQPTEFCTEMTRAMTEDKTEIVPTIAMDAVTFEQASEEPQTETSNMDVFSSKNSLILDDQFSRENDSGTILLQESDEKQSNAISTELLKPRLHSLNFDLDHFLVNRYSANRWSRCNRCLPP